MDSKKEGKISRIIIRISSILLLLAGIGVLVVEYIFWTNHWVSNATAVVVFVTSISLYALITFVIIKNKDKILNFGEED